MPYLLTQLWLHLLITFVLGLLLGWLIRSYLHSANNGEFDKLKSERDDLAQELETCRSQAARLSSEGDGLRARVTELETENADLRSQVSGSFGSRQKGTIAKIAQAVQAPFANTGTKPEGLSAPRGGIADDLQKISGVGPKLEAMLHDLGYYHFDQIAQWSPSEVAWVDENLEGFKGRVTRDQWIKQAKMMVQ
ncbi:MAG: hypothetical protein AAGD04_12225 [Pseudomonadota bacterium]